MQGPGGGVPVELRAPRPDVSSADVAELASMSWHLLGGRRKDRVKLTQPAAVWTYPSGETVIRCARGGKTQSLRLWLGEGRRGRGRRRLYDWAAAARAAGFKVEETLAPAAPEEGDGPTRISRYSPMETSYPFGDVRAWERKSKEKSASEGPDDRNPQPDYPQQTRRLPWRVLPPGELTEETLLGHYEALEWRDPATRYEPDRIRKAFSLRPNNCYVGEDEFDGYVVFTFSGTEKALLECPVHGNAIYVLGSDWRRLSRLSKRELLADGTRGTKKIVHRGDWFGRAKLALGLR